MISYTATTFENSGHFIPQGYYCVHVFTSRDNTEIQHQQVKSLINAGTDVPSIHCEGGYKPVDQPISDCPIVHSTCISPIEPEQTD